MKLLALILVLFSVLCLTATAFKYDFERDLDSDAEEQYVEKKEASEFLKRFLHPFSSKNEEIKRETREVYEEKCESVVPTQR